MNWGLIALAFLTIANQPVAALTYGITVWVGTEVDIEFGGNFSIAENDITFYDGLTQAALEDSRFAFESTYYEGLGHFITKVGAYSSDPEENLYWMFYVLPSKPNRDTKPSSSDLSQTGVDSTKLINETHYLLWLRKVSIDP